MAEGISIREFARREGCSDTLVRRAIREGHLPKLSDGKLDPALVGTGWRKSNRGEAASDSIVSRDLTDLPAQIDLVKSFLADVLEGNFASQAEAERAKENALAALRIGELMEKSGRLVEIEDVGAVIDAQFARVRTKLLALPAECAPRLAALKGIGEITEFLTGAVTEALEELVGYAVRSTG